GAAGPQREEWQGPDERLVALTIRWPGVTVSHRTQPLRYGHLLLEDHRKWLFNLHPVHVACFELPERVHVIGSADEVAVPAAGVGVPQIHRADLGFMAAERFRDVDALALEGEQVPALDERHLRALLEVDDDV